MNRGMGSSNITRPFDSTTLGETKLFALALLGKPLPEPGVVSQQASDERERLEWLAGISERHAQQLRRLELAKANARDQRERLEWLAQISERHDHKLREVLREEAEAREVQARTEQLIDDRSAYEAWDPSKHPRRGGAPNAG